MGCQNIITGPHQVGQPAAEVLAQNAQQGSETLQQEQAQRFVRRAHYCKQHRHYLHSYHANLVLTTSNSTADRPWIQPQMAEGKMLWVVAAYKVVHTACCCKPQLTNRAVGMARQSFVGKSDPFLLYQHVMYCSDAANLWQVWHRAQAQSLRARAHGKFVSTRRLLLTSS